MNTAIFDYEQFHELIEQFAEKLPPVLAHHYTTADLVPRVTGLVDATERPFTVAIVGQMRLGKSTLLNALVGVPDLAVTGVNETTATVNRFRYGVGDQCQQFRVIWKDKPEEMLPRSEVAKWVGDSGLAKATQSLHFFADSPFLRVADVVDTPGMRSVLADHEETVQEFLALRGERESRREGEAAHAIVYVLMPVTRQNDLNLLADFESATRVSGSKPYNSIADTLVHPFCSRFVVFDA